MRVIWRKCGQCGRLRPPGKIRYLRYNKGMWRCTDLEACTQRGAGREKRKRSRLYSVMEDEFARREAPLLADAHPEGCGFRVVRPPRGKRYGPVQPADHGTGGREVEDHRLRTGP
jgi:hypothetical protein